VAFNIGDKVKFLNATGGGIVRKILDSRLVSVAIEGGFEIPVQASELLLIEPSDAGSRFFNQTFEVAAQGEELPQTGVPSSDPVELPRSVISSRRSEEILLAFVPHDQKWLITGYLDVFLVNNTSYDLLYNLFRKHDDGGWSGADYGSTGAGTRLLMATIHRDELVHWTEGCLQFLFHRGRIPEIPGPFQAEYSISGKKFFSEAGYRESVYVTGRAVVVKITTLEEKVHGKKDPPDQVQAVREVPSNSDEFILRHRTGEREAIVDLHIHELVEDPAAFEKVEILEYQKNYFHRCLESAIANGYLKVTFIHGIGNGVLRDVLLDLLKKQEGIEVFDAPMQKYGAGAIEVRIPHNR
jgi:hypothetical protein